MQDTVSDMPNGIWVRGVGGFLIYSVWAGGLFFFLFMAAMLQCFVRRALEYPAAENSPPAQPAGCGLQDTFSNTPTGIWVRGVGVFLFNSVFTGGLFYATLCNSGVLLA